MINDQQPPNASKIDLISLDPPPSEGILPNGEDDIMAYDITIICLAASRKKGSYCYAGKDVEDSEWVRPVTNHGEHEVSAAEATNDSGKITAVGDIVRIAFEKHDPFHFQHENHLMLPQQRWVKVDEAVPAELVKWLDDPNTLWASGGSSWGYRNNRVSEAVANEYQNSLYLIRPDGLSISVGRKGGDYADANKRLVKAHFRYNGVAYTLQVTDPAIEAAMWAGIDRTIEMPNALLCVSLGGAYLGHAYKLVATVISLG